MLGGLLGQGFCSKCKSLIKPTKTRIEAQRRRAEAKQRFLKEDLGKLLANGLDINAYGRTEDFIAGLRLLCCYDYIENYCDYILKNLSTMQKQKECPEVCREAVSSLMYAAARFSDLPELRDLRDAFQERYGNSIEHSVNKMFIDALAAKPPTMEKRLQLLQDIASEFSIKWDSRGFEQRMAKPSALVQDQFKRYGLPHVTTDKCGFSNGKDTKLKASKHEVIAKEMGNFIIDRQNMHNGKGGTVFRREEVDTNFIGRPDKTGKGNNLQMTGEGKREIKDVSYQGRQELNEEKHRLSQHKEDSATVVSSSSSSHGKSIDNIYPLKNSIKNPIAKDERRDPLFHGKSEDAANCARLSGSSNSKSGSSVGNEHPNRLNVRNSSKQVQEEEADGSKSYYNSPRPPPYVKLKDNTIPPPYVKHKESNCKTHTRSKHTSFDGDCSSIDPSSHIKAVASLNSYGIQKEQKISQHDEGFGPTRVNSHGHEKDPIYQNDIPLPKPRSVRKKHSRSSSSHQYDDGKLEDAETVRRSSSSRRKEYSRKGLQILFDDEHHEKDEEERMMDKLLLHYSKKASNFEVKKLKKKSQAHASHQKDADGSRLPPRSRAGRNVNAEMVPPSRSKSLPREQPTPSEPIKVYARANSFQPDNQAPHVHPKLPDYDDLAARFAALRGR